MNQIKVLTVLGARPQFIKSALVSKAFRSYPISEVLIHTGQHFDENMSEIFFSEMEISEPKYNLGINSLGHGQMMGQMLEKLEPIMMEEKPDLVLVYGDTNSTLAGALAAKKLGIKIGHIEAGLRSWNNSMPEETNRILTDRISDLLFCPTAKAVGNLRAEGYEAFDCEVIQSGDVMYDAVKHFSSRLEKKSKIILEQELDKTSFAVCTVHREDNTQDADKMHAIFKALNTLSKKIRIVMPVHPRTQKWVDEFSLDQEVRAIGPVGYLDMMALLRECSIVLTDSGGLQKEAYFHRKFCVTLRNETEWTELVEGGYNSLVGPNEVQIVQQAEQLLGKDFVSDESYYGQGDASEIIAKLVASSVRK